MHPKNQTPYVAISLVAVLGIVAVLWLPFERLADAFVTAMLPFYAGGVAAVFVLRKRPGYKAKFSTPGYPIIPAIFLASVAYLLINGLLDPAGRIPTALVFGVVLLGIPVYKIFLDKKSA